MVIHRNGSIVLAKAEQGALVSLQQYINDQASKHDVYLLTEIRAV